jgi:hypothetical protein
MCGVVRAAQCGEDDPASTLQLMDVAVTWTAIGAFGTIVAAGVAAWAARQSRNSAREANAAAKSLAAIERGRRHDELAPEFELKVAEIARDRASLMVTLTGGRMDRLDEVTVTILDEKGKDHWVGGLPGGLKQEEAEAFVWGPWEFLTAASVQIVSNRQSRPKPYSRVDGKNWDLLPLVRTQPGHWMTSYTQEYWHEDFEEQPVRFLITCRREGYEPWTLLKEVVVGRAGSEERQQAEQIDVSVRQVDGAQAKVLPPDKTEPVHIVVVTNGSQRPIREVACKIEAIQADETIRQKKEADVYGEWMSYALGYTALAEAFVPQARATTMPVLKAGHKAGLASGFTASQFPRVITWVRFTDDAGLHWEIDTSLQLRKLDYRHW